MNKMRGMSLPKTDVLGARGLNGTEFVRRIQENCLKQCVDSLMRKAATPHLALANEPGQVIRVSVGEDFGNSDHPCLSFKMELGQKSPHLPINLKSTHRSVLVVKLTLRFLNLITIGAANRVRGVPVGHVHLGTTLLHSRPRTMEGCWRNCWQLPRNILDITNPIAGTKAAVKPDQQEHKTEDLEQKSLTYVTHDAMLSNPVVCSSKGRNLSSSDIASGSMTTQQNSQSWTIGAHHVTKNPTDCRIEHRRQCFNVPGHLPMYQPIFFNGSNLRMRWVRSRY
ncbi:uncharacterized protein [Narcine bancroftii]|uniref:uncharacterized protein n=1 Tax=Narcine bancroftii TaxID=1343680 RepID=UPI003831693F